MQQNPHGHLSTKSSLYAVGNSKWTSQRLVKDHMDVHYKKLLNAKSAIDNKVPKSTQTSVKARDTLRRKDGKNSRPSTAMGLHSFRNSNNRSNELRDTFSVHSILDNESNSGSYSANQHEFTPMWSPSVGFSVFSSNNAQNPRLSFTKKGTGGAGVVRKNGKHRQIAGDHLDKFSTHFDNRGDFQPRILKTSKGESRLAASRNYVPPRKVRSSIPANRDSEVTMKPTSTTAPRETNTIVTKSDSASQSKNNKLENPTFMRNTTEDTSSKLNRKGGDEGAEYDKIGDEDSLRFVTEVTEDILNRQIFSNRAIEGVLQEHYSKNKGKLSERSLQHALNSLRQDFGLREHSEGDDTFSSRRGSNSSNHTYHASFSDTNNQFDRVDTSLKEEVRQEDKLDEIMSKINELEATERFDNIDNTAASMLETPYVDSEIGMNNQSSKGELSTSQVPELAVESGSTHLLTDETSQEQHLDSEIIAELTTSELPGPDIESTSSHPHSEKTSPIKQRDKEIELTENKSNGDYEDDFE